MCICGCSWLESRHHQAARTLRQRRYADSGGLNVMTLFMASSLRKAHAKPRTTAPVTLTGCSHSRSLAGGWTCFDWRGAGCEDGQAELRETRQRLRDACQPFHRLDDYREVLIGMRCHL